jgi:hypothetical protein
VVDLDEVIRSNDSKQLAAKVGELLSVVSRLDVPKEQRALLTRVLTAFQSEVGSAASSDERMSVYLDKMRKLKDGLPESTYSRVVSMFESWASSEILVASRAT